MQAGMKVSAALSSSNQILVYNNLEALTSCIRRKDATKKGRVDIRIDLQRKLALFLESEIKIKQTDSNKLANNTIRNNKATKRQGNN